MLTWKAQKNPIRAIAFSPDGKYLATGASNESVWKLHALGAGGAHEVVFEGEEATPYGCSSLSFSRDGKLLVGVGSSRIWMVDLREPTRIRSTTVLKGRAAGMFSCASFCGAQLFGFGAHMMRWTFELSSKEKTGSPPGGVPSKDAKSQKPQKPQKAQAPQKPQKPQKPQALRNGTLVETSGETFYGAPMIVSPDESVVVATVVEQQPLGGGRYQTPFVLFDPKSGQVLGKLVRGPTFPGRDPKTACFSPDGSLLVSGHGGTIAVHDVASRKEIRAWSTGTKDINDLTFSGDGSRLLAVSNDLSARQWDTKSWKEVRALESDIGKLTRVTRSADGCLFAAGSHLGRIMIWDAV
jgi:hypothetical protein